MSVYGSRPGQHEPNCAWEARKSACDCPYGERYVRDVSDVATELIRACIEQALDFDLVDWSDYPDLPEFAWEAVVAEARRRYRHSDHEDAYQRLASVATEEIA